MANGTLGKSIAVANSWLKVYTVPATMSYAVVQIECLNVDPSNTAKIYLAVSLEDKTPAVVDRIESGAVLPADGGLLERTAVVVGPNESVFINSNNSQVIIRVSGIEQS